MLFCAVSGVLDAYSSWQDDMAERALAAMP
jgi:hypothetical protein